MLTTACKISHVCAECIASIEAKPLQDVMSGRRACHQMWVRRSIVRTSSAETENAIVRMQQMLMALQIRSNTD